MQCYLVGGAVRDKLLNYPHHERDWVVVGATADEMLARGFKQVGKDFPVFLHPDSGEEYALARTERKSGAGYYGFECNASPEVTLEEDLLRRDLTINAMAEDDDGTIIDPYGGRDDLARSCLRHVSPAFAEDPLRVLRVARFAARYAHLGFQVAPETLALMREMSAGGELSALAAERIWVEVDKALGERTPAQFVRVLLDCGALAALYPAWAARIDDSLLAALQLAVEHGVASAGRFALLCSRLAAQDCRAFCTALKAPNSHCALALQVCTHSPLAPAASLSAEAVLQLLEALDCLRRPQQLQQFIEVERALYPRQDALALLQTAADTIRRIRPDALLLAGHKGAALGQALRAQRLAAIEELLCPPQTPPPSP